jgi:hypothetical protein
MPDFSSPRSLSFWFTKGLWLFAGPLSIIILLLAFYPASKPYNSPMVLPALALSSHIPTFFVLSAIKRLAKRAKASDLCLCHECGYTIDHRYAPCPECGDATPPLPRDKRWIKFMGFIGSPLEFYTPSPLATADQVLPFRHELLTPSELRARQRKRSRIMIWSIVLILMFFITCAIVLYQTRVNSNSLIMVAIAVSLLAALAILPHARSSSRDTQLAFLYAYRQRAFCIPCGCPLEHTHAPCPQCADTTPPAHRDQWWKELFQSLSVKLPAKSPT